MSLKHPAIDYKTEVRKEFAKLDAKGLIDQTKVYNALHYERVIEQHARKRAEGESKKEVYDPIGVQIALNSRHYNFLRPKNAPFFDELEYYKTHTMRTDPKPITREERTKLLELPLDQLRQQIANRLVTLGKSNYYNNVLKLNERQFYAATELILDGFTNTIYDECFWDKILIESLISLVLERVN